MLHAVIMAGGSATRFCPVSRPDRPKQFLSLLDARSLLRITWWHDHLHDLATASRA